MAELDRRYAQGTAVGREVAIDQGLRAYMIRVYNYMASGVAITGVVAWLIYSMSVVQGATGLELTPFGQFMFASAFKWVVIFAPLAMVFFLSARAVWSGTNLRFLLFIADAILLILAGGACLLYGRSFPVYTLKSGRTASRSPNDLYSRSCLNLR